jgi:phage baseplate assembly protein gpV
MATGTLGQAALTAATNTTVYTVPAGQTATVNINVVNKGSNIAAVNLAISAADTPTDSEYIEFNAPMQIGGVLERTGIVLSAGKKVVAKSTVSGITVNIYGYEA